MHEGATTHALVVGIDEYQDPWFGRLKGAVADAIAAVAWLRSLGVPSSQILLHAAPSEASRAALVEQKLEWLPATWKAIWSSVNKLGGTSGGTRLFVFLSGHGYYEPQSGRLFLVEDAGIDGAFLNLGIDRYLDLLRSYVFPRIFVFLDGCQNYSQPLSARPKITAQDPPINGFTPREENVLAAGFAAAQGQLAVEAEGRGLFLRHLLGKLDPGSLWPDAVDLDFQTGGRTVDLNTLFYDYVLPKVEAEAKQKNVRQTPELLSLGSWTSEARPIFALAKAPAAALSVQISPEAAIPAIRFLQIWAKDDLRWCLKKPRLDEPLVPPVEAWLPLGTETVVQCRIRNGEAWEIVRPHRGKSEHEVAVTGPMEVRFELEPRPREAEALPAPPTSPPMGMTRGAKGSRGAESRSVEIFGAGDAPTIKRPPGNRDPYDDPVRRPGRGRTEEESHELIEVRTDGAGSRLDYGLLARTLGLRRLPEDGDEIADGVWIRKRLRGPAFTVRRGALARGHEIALEWQRAIRKSLPPGAGVVLTSTAEGALGGNLRLTLPDRSAEALAGPLADLELVWVGAPDEAPAESLWQDGPPPPSAGTTVSLRGLENGGLLRVEPGPVRVRLDLPWGSWTKLVRAPETGEETVELPRSVGQPPLRVALAHNLQVEGTAIVGMEGTAPKGRWWLDGFLGGDAPLAVPRTARPAAWNLAPSREPSTSRALADLDLGDGRRGIFPLLPRRVFGVDRSFGGLRVEPLSATPVAAWDLLMTSGRLDLLDHHAVLALLGEGKDDLLLALAAGYVALARPLETSTPLLGRTLKRLNAWQEKVAERRDGVLDLDLLCLALSARKGNEKAQGLPKLPSRKWLRENGESALTRRAEEKSVPLWRWGFPLASHVLAWLGDEPEVETWRSLLEGIELRLSPTSTWTAWIVEPAGAGEAKGEETPVVGASPAPGTGERRDR